MDLVIAIPGFTLISIAYYSASTTWCIAIPLLYLSWRVVYSQSHFHLIWSVSLTACGLLKWSASQASSIPTFVLWILCCAIFLFISLIPIYQLAKRLIYGVKGGNSDDQSAVCLSGDAPLSVDVVAVHGLGSHRTTAWEGHLMTPDKKRVMWLRDFLCKEEDLRCRVILFQYRSQWASDANKEGINEYGQELLQALRRKRMSVDEQCRPIIFIGHSFGGLVIKQMLVIAGNNKNDLFCTELCRSTKSIIFMGTPHKGAKVTKVGRLIAFMGHFMGSSTALLDFVEPTSKHNEDLHRQFMKWSGDHLHMKHVRCIYETVPHSAYGLPLIEVVTKESAVLDGSDAYPRHKVHRKLQRFDSCEDDAYRDLVIWIRQELHSMTTTPSNQIDLVFLNSLKFPRMIDRQTHDCEIFEDTCDWLYDNLTFRAWADHQVLWIKGSPGSGKSTLMSFLQMECKDLEGKDISGKYISLQYYFDKQSELQARSLDGLLRSFLYQLCDKAPSLAACIQHHLGDNSAASGSTRVTVPTWSYQEIESAFFAVVDTIRTTTLVLLIDALDEALEREIRKTTKFLEKVCTRFDEQQRKIRLCISCREYPQIANITGLEIVVQDHNHAEVSKYLAHELSQKRIPTVCRLNQTEWHQIVEELLQRAGASFQWASIVAALAFRYVSACHPMKILRARLLALPKELSLLYEHILIKEIWPEDWPRSLLLLQWVCLAERPLSITELRYALALESIKPNESYEYWDELDDFISDDESMKLQVTALSGGLLEVVRHTGGSLQKPDYDRRCGELSTQDISICYVQACHQSVIDFVLSKGLSLLSSKTHFPAQFLQITEIGLAKEAKEMERQATSDGLDSTLIVSASHARIFTACLLYFRREAPLANRQRPSQPDETEVKGIPEIPFLAYTTRYLFFHAAMSQQYFNEIAIDWCRFLHLVEDIFEIWYWSSKPKRLQTIEEEWRNCLLHVAAQYDLEGVVRALLLKSQCPINARDAMGRTALNYAASIGSPAITKLLLDHGAWPIVEDSNQKSPLLDAASGGETQRHIETVKLLLAQGVNIDFSKDYRGTAIQQAASKGYTRMVKTLLDFGADLNTISGSSGTALHQACLWQHTNVIDLLLKRGADPHIWSASAFSRLSSTQSRQRIVAALQAAGVAIDMSSAYYKDDFPYASFKEFEASFPDPFRFDDGLFFKLFYDPATFSDIEEVDAVVHFLALVTGYKDGDSGFYSPDLHDHLTGPLAHSIKLEWKNVALFIASAWGQVETVHILLKSGAEVNARVTMRCEANVFAHCRTALQAASFRNATDIVRILREYGASTNVDENVA